ncbi:hypothetical protein BT69DRAFT_1306600, partial [Atractiella rhizophila]
MEELPFRNSFGAAHQFTAPTAVLPLKKPADALLNTFYPVSSSKESPRQDPNIQLDSQCTPANTYPLPPSQICQMEVDSSGRAGVTPAHSVGAQIPSSPTDAEECEIPGNLLQPKPVPSPSDSRQSGSPHFRASSTVIKQERASVPTQESRHSYQLMERRLELLEACRKNLESDLAEAKAHAEHEKAEIKKQAREKIVRAMELLEQKERESQALFQEWNAASKQESEKLRREIEELKAKSSLALEGASRWITPEGAVCFDKIEECKMETLKALQDSDQKKQRVIDLLREELDNVTGELLEKRTRI